MNMNFENGFHSFWIIFIVIFAAVAAVFVAVAVKSLRNHRAPILTTSATVADKRSAVSRTQIPNAGDPTGAHGYQSIHSTRYFITFRLEGGSRTELEVDAILYDALAEGDRGALTYQGSRCLDFRRT